MENNFIQRWSLRKLDRQHVDTEGDKPLQQSPEPDRVQTTREESGQSLAENQASLPPEDQAETGPNEPAGGAGTQALESAVAEDSEDTTTSSGAPSLAQLMASGAESAVKKAALRKLFFSGAFNELDGLNDYDHDYKAVGELSAEVAGKLRNWLTTQEDDNSQQSADNQEDNHDSPALQAEQTNDEKNQTVKASPEQTVVGGDNPPGEGEEDTASS
ncbi:DUF3306 domain-containing protein [Vibrio sp.]|uniref:DUF3306 domain-containing protein n=1 Tax=Vibrio sp. TaxID=678 RepID=UPI003D0DA4AD